MTNICSRKPKTDRKCTKPQTYLQRLAGSVYFCINFRIQQCFIPNDLAASAHTWELSSQITDLQNQLKDSLKHDYERQKANILSIREANKRTP